MVFISDLARLRMILNLNQPTSFLFLILGSLSNEDGDGHVNGKKAIGLGPVHKYPYSLENATFFLRSQKKIRVHS